MKYRDFGNDFVASDQYKKYNQKFGYAMPQIQNIP